MSKFKSGDLVVLLDDLHAGFRCVAPLKGTITTVVGPVESPYPQFPQRWYEVEHRFKLATILCREDAMRRVPPPKPGRWTECIWQPALSKSRKMFTP